MKRWMKWPLALAVIVLAASVSVLAGRGRAEPADVSAAEGGPSMEAAEADRAAAAADGGETGDAATESMASGSAMETAASGAHPAAGEAANQGEGAPAANAASGAQPAPALYPVTATTLMLENERFALYLDEKTGNVRITDKRSGREWLGAPQVERTTMPNNKRFMDAPVHVRYTTGAGVSQTHTLNNKENTLEIRKLDDAVRVEFRLAEEQISFAVEYRLREDGLDVRLPFDAIREEGQARLISLEPLPFLFAARETDEGFILVPDGAGALMRFKAQHPAYLKGYSEPIYGPDYAFKVQHHDMVEEEWLRAVPPKEYATLPVFGISRNGAGVLAIVEDGQFDAKINATPPGVRNIALYRASVEFVYRKDDVIFVGSSGQIPYYQGRLIEGDRNVRFVLLQGEASDYVGMARVYRDYLVREKQVMPVEAEPRLHLRLFGGVLRDEIIGQTFVDMTTFRQAREIIDAFAARGIHDLDITFEGWSKGGYYGNQPDHFPVEKKLGGAAELRELVRYARERGIDLYVQVNYVRAYAESGGISRRRDSIHGLDREAVPSYDYYVSTRVNRDQAKFYHMKPERVYDRRIAPEREAFARLGVAGVHLQYMGHTLYSDQDRRHLADRRDTAGVWVRAMDDFRRAVGKTGVDYGFAYALGHVDRIDNAPMDSSHFVVMDETVPFWQIVVRGLVPYTAPPVNLRDDARAEFLRMLEYGALPSFELTYAPTSDLRRTLAERLFSTRYADWLDAAAAEYAALRDHYVRIANEPIVNHEQLGEGVYRTTFGNGVQVTVNYTDREASVGETTVPARGYVIGEGQSA